MSDELDTMWERLSAIMSTHTCKEIIEGVWEHTFTPNNGRQWYWQIGTEGLTEDVPSANYTTCAQSTDTMTADELLKIAKDIEDQRTQDWLEEYDRYSHVSMLREIEEMSKPLYDTPYLRYLAWQPQIVMQPVRLLPFRAEGTPDYALSCALPQLSAVEAHRAINNILNSVNYSKSLRRVAQENRAKKRERRQHRAAFRRRKRGLA